MRKFDSFSLIVVIVCSLFFFIFGVGLTAFTALESVVGDVATWVAAVGTVSTLGFAIRQNRILREEQKQERLDREDHECKQQKMWEFQKYRMHYQSFNECLDTLEDRFKRYGLRFDNRTRLYKKIFPDNNYDNVACVSTTIHEITLNEVRNLNNGLSSLHNEPLRDLSSLFSSLFSSLCITFDSKSDIGQLMHYDLETCFNIFDYDLHIQIYYDLAHELLNFSHAEPLDNIGKKYPRLSNAQIEALLDTYFNNDEGCYTNYYWLFLGEGNFNLLRELWLINKLVKKAMNGFSRRASTTGFHQPYICSPLFDFFTQEGLERLNHEQQFRKGVINKYVSSIEEQIRKDSKYRLELEEAKGRLLSISKDLDVLST